MSKRRRRLPDQREALHVLHLTGDDQLHQLNGRLVILYPLRDARGRDVYTVAEEQVARALALGATNPLPLVACYGEALLILDVPEVGNDDGPDRT